jgi:hypothetical protein
MWECAPLADDGRNGEQPPSHYEGGVAILPGQAERADSARRAQEKEEHDYKQRQVSIQNRIFVTQAVLVVFGIIGTIVSIYQAKTARISADAANSAATTAHDTLVEMRSGGTAQDTHTLAQQAVAQAAQTTNLANGALATQRPWLRLSMRLWRPVEPYADGYTFIVVPSITNIGTGVASEAKMYFEAEGFAEIAPINKALAVKDWCKSLKPDFIGFGDEATYFPGVTVDTPKPGLGIVTTNKKWKKSDFNEADPRVDTLIYGCVLYRFAPFPEWHHTSVVYNLRLADVPDSDLFNGGGLPLIPRKFEINELNLRLYTFSPEWGD